MEDLYLRFEREKQILKIQFEKEFEEKMKKEKQKFNQKIDIYKTANGMNSLQKIDSGYQDTKVVIGEQDNSIEYAKATVLISQAYDKNKGLDKQIETLEEVISQKDIKLQQADCIIEQKDKECDIFVQKIEALKQTIIEREEYSKSLERKIDFLEQTHLSKANFYSNKEKNYINKMKGLESHLDNLICKEAMAKETITDRRQKW
eukprot:CAMPEP_0205803646 /NCGR_PEP_ID=MMETSP0205-20121125/6364_1 /ASSEMBLY_ACC=CAM_ASM_000278 /TAXON_ID=36767 /ORGANISM="Euplotes focardii, Strain TN1" /LENGTH=203 /DNA_ID=CAMNT_0053072061 /DNA_START=192 /DNA_END=800 /DNA_ORIENTATION=-